MARLARVWSIPDLRAKLVQLIAVLALVRLMTNLPLIGQPPNLAPLFRGDPFLSLFDVFAGGAASRFSVLALGVYPYVLTRVLMRVVLATVYDDIISYGESGRERWERYVRAVTVVTAIAMGIGYLYLISRLGITLPIDGLSLLTIVTTLAAGAMLFLWLADEFGEQGIEWLVTGNVLAVLPLYLVDGVQSAWDMAARILVPFVVVYVYLITLQGERRVPVQYSRPRASRRRILGSQTYIPIQFNAAGLTPFLYLLSLLGVMHIGSLLFQASEVGWIRLLVRLDQQLTNTRGLLFWCVFGLVSVPLRYMFGTARFQDLDIAGSLQLQGGSIPGIRSGSPTRDYLNSIFARLAPFEAILTTSLLVIPALCYYTYSQSGIWPILLIPAMYITRPIWDLARSIEAKLSWYQDTLIS